VSVGAPAADRVEAARTGRVLQHLTIGWNAAECVVALVAGGVARQTEFCAYLSVILLAGLALNAWLGWWWADPVAALAMVPLLTREGLEAWRGRVVRQFVWSAAEIAALAK
jgi:hypothetical protein